MRGGVPTLCWTHYKPTSRGVVKNRTSRKLTRKNKKVRQLSNLGYMVGALPGRRTFLFNKHVAECGNPTWYPTALEELSLLFDSIVLYGVGYDPCAGSGTIGRVTMERNPNVSKVHTRDIDTTHLHLDTYGDSLATAVPPNLDFIIMSPPFVTMDLWLVWAESQKVDVVVVHAAGDLFSNSNEARKGFFAPYMNNDLLCMVEGLPLSKGRKKRRCAFIIWFRSKQVRDACFRRGKICKLYHNKYIGIE